MERRKIKDDIKRSFIKYAVVIIAIILFVYLISLYLIFNVSIVKPNQKINEQVAAEIEAGFEEYRAGLSSLIKDEAITSFLSGAGEGNVTNRILYDFRNAQQMNADFVLLNEEEEIIATSYYDGIEQELSQSIFMNELVNKANKNGMIEERLNKRIMDVNHEASYVFTAAIPGSDGTIGYLMFFLENQLPSTNNQLLFVTDPFDNVIFYSHSFALTTLGKLELEKGHFIQADTDYFFKTRTTISENDIQVITLTSIYSYRLLLFYGLLTMVVSSLVMILVVWIVTPKILKKSLQPFDALVTMISTKNHNQHFQKEHIFDEVQTIYEEYTSKINEIQFLVDQNQEIMEKRKLSEMKHLEAKFNPHFLFNVLEMIKYETLADPENASDMIVKTAKLMRYNTNFGDTTVPLEKDLSYLEDYFSLQKMRYGKRLNYSIQIEPYLYEAHIPKLMIQPLIENAIKHNINETHGLLVELTIEVLGETLMLIRVKDNGLGMKPETLALVQAILAGDMKETEHTGMKNTHQLIQLLYGTEYGLDIETTLGEGTVISLQIPYKG
ncbi:sensor histidine kinase [Alkalicoccobacillus murimartini]|uniref:Two-component system sensor histidine kinase YesM n=1 Tax=Alkalicoccobacillus murimartini TaxID=171685 RepID=A0ABT9YHP1_9BACI|nr:histidine kinase [Alkalicoccobacillus murimartini]MDQ0207378.1 two-component system sensor histidine kinase YesM [Alkalicoccobacillus murimartini]